MFYIMGRNAKQILVQLIKTKLFSSEKPIGVICHGEDEYVQLCQLFYYSGKTWCNGESYLENNLYQQLDLDCNDVIILGNDGKYVLEKELNMEGEDMLEYYDECITFSSLITELRR